MTNITFRQTTIVYESAQPMTLFQLNQQIREELELSFPETYWVVAEIAEVNAHRGSGHCYLNLIDKAPGFQNQGKVQAQARATIWSSRFQGISRQFENLTGQKLRPGLKILFSTRVRFHELYGLSLDIQEIDPHYTLGDLARQRQETINRLVSEGLFDLNREKRLARVPQRLAVISSATAAGYQDFMHQLGQNLAGYQFQVRLFPATMQGNDAPASVARALQIISDHQEQFDAVVVIRGGGSQTDLQCFDHYTLAAAIAACPLPVLTGIGHERDETIADLVAHTRLKTPTAVADFIIDRCRAFEEAIEHNFARIRETAARRVNELTEQLTRHSREVYHLTNTYLSQQQNRISRLSQSLLHKPKDFLAAQQHELNCLELNLIHAAQLLLQEKQNRLRQVNRQLESKARHLLNTRTHVLQRTGQCVQTGAQKAHLRGTMQLGRLQGQLLLSGKQALQQASHRLALAELRLKAHDPEQLLLRGYTLTLVNGRILKAATNLQAGDVLETRLPDAKIISTITEISKKYE